MQSLKSLAPSHRPPIEPSKRKLRLNGKSPSPFKHGNIQSSSLKHILLVASASKNRRWKAEANFRPNTIQPGASLALSVYVNSDTGRIVYAFYAGRKYDGKLVRDKQRFDSEHIPPRLKNGHRLNDTTVQMRLWSFYLLMFIVDIWQSIRSSIRLSIIARGAKWIRLYSVTWCALCRACNLSRGRRRFVNGGRKRVMTH